MMHEMSMNFDLENVEPFLKRISPLFDNGFGADEIIKASEFTSSLNVEEEKAIEFTIQFQGKDEKMIYRVFMDDIGNEYEKMCEELGI